MVKNLPPQPGWEESWGRTDTCICVAETLHYLPETITTLLIGYTPIKNKKLKKRDLPPNTGDAGSIFGWGTKI